MESFTTSLEEANIIVDKGVRLGTNEVTRRGMKPREMEKIAEMIGRVYKVEDSAKVKRLATKLRKSFPKIQYT